MLTVKFWRIKHLVVAEIIDQDDRLRHMDEYSLNGFKIKARRCPQIKPFELYIRGTSKSYDHEIVSYSFADVDEAKWYVKEMSKAIAELNKSFKSKLDMSDIADIEITTAF